MTEETQGVASDGVVETNTGADVTAEQLYAVQVQGLRAAYGDEVVVKKVAYNFRVKKTDSGKKNEDGSAIMDEYKRPSVVVPLIYPSQQKIATILAGSGPARDLIFQALENVAYDAGYELVAGDSTITSATFPIDQLDWDAIAARAAAAGTSRGLDMDALKAFAEDYKACMGEISGRPENAVKNAADAFMQRFAKHRTATSILKQLNAHLNTYIEKAPNAGMYADTVEWLKNKLTELLSASVDDLYLL